MERKERKTKALYPEEIIHRAKILDMIIKKQITQTNADHKRTGLKSDRQYVIYSKNIKKKTTG